MDVRLEVLNSNEKKPPASDGGAAVTPASEKIALPHEEVQAARDDDRRAHPDVGAGHVAEDQVAEEGHVDDLLVEERREDRGGGITVRQREEVMAQTAQHAEQAGERPLE